MDHDIDECTVQLLICIVECTGQSPVLSFCVTLMMMDESDEPVNIGLTGSDLAKPTLIRRQISQVVTVALFNISRHSSQYTHGIPDVVGGVLQIRG